MMKLLPGTQVACCKHPRESVVNAGCITSPASQLGGQTPGHKSPLLSKVRSTQKSGSWHPFGRIPPLQNSCWDSSHGIGQDREQVFPS